jgi:hypothetical protein
MEKTAAARELSSTGEGELLEERSLGGGQGEIGSGQGELSSGQGELGGGGGQGELGGGGGQGVIVDGRGRAQSPAALNGPSRARSRPWSDGEDGLLCPTTSYPLISQTKKWLIPYTEPNRKNGYP